MTFNQCGCPYPLNNENMHTSPTISIFLIFFEVFSTHNNNKFVMTFYSDLESIICCVLGQHICSRDINVTVFVHCVSRVCA